MPDPLWKQKRVRLPKDEYFKQREDIFDAQNYICAGCGRRRPLTRQHKKKRSQLGGDERDNAVGLCAECHRKEDEYEAQTKGKPSCPTPGIPMPKE